MSHIYRLILVLNAALLSSLIFLAFKEKQKLTSERARELISSKWNLFSLVVSLALLALLLFLVHESREFAQAVLNIEVQPLEEEINSGIAIFVFLASLVNLYIVLRISRGKEPEAAK